jgi:hypothetical protein
MIIQSLVHLNIVVLSLMNGFDFNIDERIEIELDFEVVCDVVPKSVEQCYDIISTHGFVHGNDVAKNRFFEIDKDTRRKVDFFNWSL